MFWLEVLTRSSLERPGPGPGPGLESLEVAGQSERAKAKTLARWVEMGETPGERREHLANEEKGEGSRHGPPTPAKLGGMWVPCGSVLIQDPNSQSECLSSHARSSAVLRSC